MSIPTLTEVREAYLERFGRVPFTHHEWDAIRDILRARQAGVGYGWMRQAIGIIWKLDDPRGYLDDERLIELHTPKRRARKAKR